MSKGDLLLRRLGQVFPIPKELDHLEMLLNDYLACLVDGEASDFFPLFNDGAIERATYFSLKSSSKDRDDVDWTLGVHLGSVVWSTIFGLTLKHVEYRRNAVLAALSGYRTGASVATFLGKSHRDKWHVTATAGSVAAASATSVVLGLSPSAHENALRLAISNMGGSAQAPKERQGAGGFNRAAAASLGIVAGLSNARSIDQLWDGQSGLFELYSAAGGEASVVDGIATSGIRPFPTNGFSQSAVQATAQLSSHSIGELLSIEVQIARGVLPLLDGSRGGSWWDLRFAVAAAWASGDPTKLIAAPDIERLVTVVPTDISVGGATVLVNTTKNQYKLTRLTPPGTSLEIPQEFIWAKAKWSAMTGEKDHEIAKMSRDLITGSNDESLWKFLDSLGTQEVAVEK